MVIFKNVLLLLFFTNKFTQGLEFHGGECMTSSERDFGYIHECRRYGCYNIHKLKMNLTCSSIDDSFNIPDNNNLRDVTVESVTFNSEVTTLPSAAFTNLPLFSNLYLQNLGLNKILPGAFNAQHNLTQIYLDGNRLSNVSDGIFNSLMKLRILNLARNRINHITPSAFVGTHLEHLYLNNNNISKLDSMLFSSQRFLKTLDLSFNNLKEINDLLQDLSVVNLNVSNNRLTNVSITFALTIINMNLSNNQIEFLNVDKTNSIRVLDISKNKISTLKDMLSEHLEVLVAGYNSISQLDNNTFKDSVTLRELHLNNNNLSTILSSTFKNLHNLEYLNLSTNRLSSFVFGTFDGLQDLTTLDISKNKFKILPYAFHSLYRLENFYFQYNEINDINMTEFLQQKPNLTHVRLDNNKWQCNKLMYIANQFKHHNVYIIKGNYLETSNIYGIQCQEDHFHSDKDEIKNNMKFDTDIYIPSVDKTDNKDFKVNLEILTDKLVKNQEMFLDKLTERLTSNQEASLSANKDKNKNNMQLHDLDTSKLRLFFSQNFTDSVMYRFFNKEFRNSSFARYLESLNSKNKHNLTDNRGISTESINNLTDKLEQNQETFASLLSKFENTFNSRIVANQESVEKNQKQFLDKLTDRLARNQETFLSRLHSNLISDYKGRDGFSGEAFSAKYSSERSSESNDAVFTFIVILLIVIIVILIGLVYMIVFRKQNIDDVIKRDVELSQMLSTRT